MKGLILLSLIVCSAFAIRTNSKTNMNKIIDDLKNTKTGSTLLQMVQLHAMVKGPVDELIEALEDLIDDLNDSLEDLDVNFRRRTAEHNSQVISLNQQIQDAQIDVQRSEDVITNLLEPRKAQVQNRIVQVTENIEENRKSVEEAVFVRAQDNQAYLLQVEELNSATESVDEALSLLSTLTNPSMLQLKKFQNSLKKVESNLKGRGRLAPMIKALISLASNQNFSNQDIVKQIVNALNDFRNEVVDSLNELSAAEAEAVEDHEERLAQLDEELGEFQRQIVNLTNDLTAVESKLEENQDFLERRQVDEKQYNAQLDLENSTYADETSVYQDLKAEHLREVAVTEQTVSVVKTADLSAIKAF